MGRQNAAALEFDPKPSEAAFLSDVISGANVVQVGMDVPVKFGDSIPNVSRDTPVCVYAVAKPSYAAFSTVF